MKYIVDNLSLMSLGDPDFVNTLVYNPFFNAKVYREILDSLVDPDIFPAEN